MNIKVKQVFLLCGNLCLLIGLSFLLSVTSLVSCLDFTYHGDWAMEAAILRIHERCPNITRPYTIGSSVRGRKLWVIEISDNPGVHELGNYNNDLSFVFHFYL